MQSAASCFAGQCSLRPQDVPERDRQGLACGQEGNAENRCSSTKSVEVVGIGSVKSDH